MRIMISWDANVSYQFSGGILGAVCSLVSLLELKIQQAAIVHEVMELEVLVTAHDNVSRDVETTFQVTLVLKGRRYESEPIKFHAPAGYDEPFFSLGGFGMTPEKIFDAVIGKPIRMHRLEKQKQLSLALS